MPILLAGLVGLVSGYLGTRAMEPVTTKMYEAESEADKELEKRVQPKYAFVVAAEKIAGLLGIRLDDKNAERWGGHLHYALGASWGLLYVIVRVVTGWHWLPLGLASGIAMFVIVDEAANWVFGFSAPPDKFPLAAHWRGFVGHVVYGVAVAAAAEILLALVGMN